MLSKSINELFIFSPDGEKDGELFYRFTSGCLEVEALFGVCDEQLTVYEWRSYSEGKGNTKLVLQELNRSYSRVAVKDIGAGSADKSWKYWIYMRRLGLVDELYDAKNELIP